MTVKTLAKPITPLRLCRPETYATVAGKSPRIKCTDQLHGMPVRDRHLSSDIYSGRSPAEQVRFYCQRLAAQHKAYACPGKCEKCKNAFHHFQYCHGKLFMVWCSPQTVSDNLWYVLISDLWGVVSALQLSFPCRDVFHISLRIYSKLSQIQNLTNVKWGGVIVKQSQRKRCKTIFFGN